MELPQDFFCGVFNLLNCVKRSWETGHLRGIGSFACWSVFTGSGSKIGWRIVLTVWFFCYAKNGVGIKLWWGILLVGKIIEFLATVGDHNPPVGKILTCTLKNHNLLFIIKHFESILGIIKNIWLWISENILLSTNFRKILLWTIFRKSVNNGLASCNNMN